jgi:hypothetical protein
LILVESPTDPRKTIDESARGLYFIAATSAILNLGNPPWRLLDAAMIAGLAVWFQRRRSMVAGVILLILGVIGFAVALMSLLGSTHGGKGSVLVEGIIVWLALCGILAIRRTSSAESQRRAVEQ